MSPVPPLQKIVVTANLLFNITLIIIDQNRNNSKNLEFLFVASTTSNMSIFSLLVSLAVFASAVQAAVWNITAGTEATIVFGLGASVSPTSVEAVVGCFSNGPEGAFTQDYVGKF